MDNCAYHPDREAVGACINCGKLVCDECKVILKGKIYCSPCMNDIYLGKTAAKTSGLKATTTGEMTIMTGRLKLSRILGIVTLVVSVIMLFALLITLDVGPGESRRAGSDMVNTVNGLKVAIWSFALVGGGLLGYTSAVRRRSRPGASKTLAKQLILSIVGGLLLAWSIERMAYGVAPTLSLWLGGLWYGFEAAVAAVLMNLSAFFGAFSLSRGLKL